MTPSALSFDSADCTTDNSGLTIVAARPGSAESDVNAAWWNASSAANQAEMTASWGTAGVLEVEWEGSVVDPP